MALHLALYAIGNILFVFLLDTFLSDYIMVLGGIMAYVTVGALLTLMNLFVRPLLALATLPLKLFATLLAIIIVNGVFLWLTEKIVAFMDPGIVFLEIRGGIGGWLVVAIILGIGNWIIRQISRLRKS